MPTMKKKKKKKKLFQIHKGYFSPVHKISQWGRHQFIATSYNNSSSTISTQLGLETLCMAFFHVIFVRCEQSFS